MDYDTWIANRPAAPKKPALKRVSELAESTPVFLHMRGVNAMQRWNGGLRGSAATARQTRLERF